MSPQSRLIVELPHDSRAYMLNGFSGRMPPQSREEDAQVFFIVFNASIASLASRHGDEVIGERGSENIRPGMCPCSTADVAVQITQICADTALW
jgi:hypothetical protein